MKKNYNKEPVKVSVDYLFQFSKKKIVLVNYF